MKDERHTHGEVGKTPRTDQAAASAATELTLEEAVDAARQEYDEIRCIIIDHPPMPDRVGEVAIRLYTGEVMDQRRLYTGEATVDEMYEIVELFDDDARVVIERDERDDLLLPFEVIATCETGPKDVDMHGRTTIYMSENVLGAKSLDLADGLAYLEEKLAAPDRWESDGWGVAEKLAAPDRWESDGWGVAKQVRDSD